MSTPITPQFAITEVILQRINILYNPEWDGVAWVMTPTGIKLDCIGSTGDDNGILVTNANIQITADDLPPAGQAALQDLYGFIEQALADQYP